MSNFLGDRNSWLLGDSGYPQKPFLMTPVVGAIPGTPEFCYTSRHIRGRNCVERCIGVLKARFRCLLGERKLRYDPDTVGQIISACAILHNMCIKARIDPNFDIQVFQEPGNLANVNANIDQQGIEARQNLIQRYFT